MPGLSTAIPAVALTIGLSVTACAEAGEGGGENSETPPAASPQAERPDTRTDTIGIEGMSEPIELRLHRSHDDFPLPFSTYVPADMSVSTEPEEGTVRFTAEFGGVRNDAAFVHFFVFPPGTPRQEAIALARGYETSRGIPVSQGLEPLAGEVTPRHLEWAVESYLFRYQTDGDWFAGDIGVGEHQNRHFMMVRHYPVEYGDGFGPRALLIVRTWVWGDGSRLVAEG